MLNREYNLQLPKTDCAMQKDCFITEYEDQQSNPNNQIDKLQHFNSLQQGQSQGKWSQEMLQQFKILYERYGSQWNLIQREMNILGFSALKQPLAIKNKFRNGIRGAAKLLSSCQSKLKAKRTITNSMLIIMLNFCFQLQTIIKEIGQQINENSKIFEFRTEILLVSLKIKEFSSEEIEKLIKLIKQINSKIRSFGIFKSNHVKSWKISIDNLRAICKFDNVIKNSEAQQNTNHQNNVDIKIEQNYEKQNENYLTTNQILIEKQDQKQVGNPWSDLYQTKDRAIEQYQLMLVSLNYLSYGSFENLYGQHLSQIIAQNNDAI